MDAGRARERALPVPGDEHAAALAVPRFPKLLFSYRLLRRLATLAIALGLFVLSLQLMKRGATGLTPILDGLTVDTAVNYLGFGWISAYLLGSGSPVA